MEVNALKNGLRHLFELSFLSLISYDVKIFCPHDEIQKEYTKFKFVQISVKPHLMLLLKLKNSEPIIIRADERIYLIVLHNIVSHGY